MDRRETDIARHQRHFQPNAATTNSLYSNRTSIHSPSSIPTSVAMIIFGTRSYFRTKNVSQHGFCANCNRFAKLRSYTAMNFIHVYFIPVIPISARKRTHKTCPKCNTGRELTPVALEQLIVGLKERTADALLALHSGDQTFGEINPDTGQADSCIEFLQGAFDWLFAAAEADFCQSVLASLQAPNTTYAREMLAASLATMRGQLNPAIEHYQNAAIADSKNHQPLVQAAHLLVVAKRRDEAIDRYREAIEKTKQPHERLGIYLNLGEEQINAKRYDEAVDSYEAAIAIQPSVIEDKLVAKALKKARKKSGRLAVG